MPTSLTRRPERFPNSRSQFRRLLLLIVLLVLMLFSVHWASQREHWVWLTGPQKDAEPNGR